MPNIEEFVLQLKSYMGDTLRKEGQVSHTVFTGIDEDIAKTQRALGDLGRPIHIEIDNSSLRQTSEHIDRINEKASGIGIGGIALGGLAMQGVMMAAAKADEVAHSIWNNGVELANMKVGLETFVGARAGAIVQGIQKQADYTPFTTQALEPIEAGFIATGLEEHRANRDMMNLANAVAATGGNSTVLERIGADMMGGAAKGSIQGRELMELQRTAHINIATLIAKDKYANMPLPEALKKVEDMDIKFTDFESALDTAAKKGGFFAGSLDRLSQTVGGKASTIHDKWWDVTAQLLESQNGAIKKIEDGIIHGLDDVPGLVAKLTPVLKTLVDTFSELAPHIRDLSMGLLDDLRPVGSFLFSDEMVGLGKNLLDLATGIEHKVEPQLQDFANELKIAADAVSGVAEVLGEVFKGLNGAQQWAKDHLPGWMSHFMNGGLPRLLAHGYEWGKKTFGSEMVHDLMLGGPIIGTARYAIVQYGKGNPHGIPHGMQGMFGNSLIDGLKAEMAGDYSGLSGKASGSGSASAAASDAIVGGGSKQVVINYNAPLYKVDHQTIQTVKEAVADFEPTIKDAMLRILASVPGMQ